MKNEGQGVDTLWHYIKNNAQRAESEFERTGEQYWADQAKELNALAEGHRPASTDKGDI